MRTQEIRGINFLRIRIPRFIVLGWTGAALLLGVGCQSAVPQHTNVELVNFASVQPQHHQAQAEPRQTTIAITAGTDPIQSRISLSQKPVVASVSFDDTEYQLAPTIDSADDPSLNQWHFGTMFNSQHPETPLHSQSVLPRSSTLLVRLWDDQNNFYSPESVTLLGSGLVVGGLMANTSIDENLHRHFQGSVRGATSDEWFESLHASKELGNGIYTLPVFASAWVAGEVFKENKLVETTGRWGERSIRGFVVGAPPLIVLQQLTGGSRPTETNESSEWHPFRDNNGISGHAFMGSIPFITAAKMTDSRGVKVLFYAGSALTPLSRVNDNAHYPSQVALGWWMAYLAASAVDATDNPNARWRFYPYSTADGSGMIAEFRY